MPLRLPRRDVRTKLLPPLAAILVAAGLLLSTGTPIGAATVLQDPSATPASGTTATTFVLSVQYVSDPEARPALSATVEVVGLGGSPLPMSLVAGDATNGTWETSTMLPAGSWELVFRADASGSDPTPVAGPSVTVVDVATPTPAPTPGTPTPAPSSTPTASPDATPPPPTIRPTVAPTPLPPGVTPTPIPEPGSSAPSSRAASEAPRSSSTARPSDASSTGPSASARPAPATRVPSGSAAPSPAAAGGLDDGAGRSRTGWIVLGGLTSAAGAAVLARQWLARRRAGSGVG